MKPGLFLSMVAAGILSSATAWASEGGAHVDPVSAVVLALAVVLVAAKLGGDVAVRLGQPAVLGELVAGMILGNLSLAGFDGLEPLEHDASVDMLARLGVIILLFEVGLESTVGQMLRVGVTSSVVAVTGVAVPFVLGFGAAHLALPEESVYVHVFAGATLTATSVGITARVLQDLGRSQTQESRIILGAAVIDDVLGLVILAVVGGVISAAGQGVEFSAAEVGLIVVKATGFLVGALVIGVAVSRRLFHLASRLRARGALLAAGLSFCFLLSWLAGAIGLAPIVGAFAAGLILEDVHYRDFVDRGEHSLEELVHPISGFLVPVFFVLMGMRTDLRTFADTSVLGVAALLTVVAIVGKLSCALVVPGKSLDRLSIGVGMMPRGEVGLIFANIGSTLILDGKPVVGPAMFAATVVMVVATTMVTPPALKWSLGRRAS